MDLQTISEIAALLNRKTHLHPPQTLRSHYLLSLRKPLSDEHGNITPSVDAFRFIMEVFRYAPRRRLFPIRVTIISSFRLPLHSSSMSLNQSASFSDSSQYAVWGIICFEDFVVAVKCLLLLRMHCYRQHGNVITELLLIF